MLIKKPKNLLGDTFSSVSSSTRREVNDLRKEFNSLQSNVNLLMKNSLDQQGQLNNLRNDVDSLDKKMDLLLNKISELKPDSPKSTTNEFEDRYFSAMTLQSQIFQQDIKKGIQNFLETLKTSLEIESKCYEQKLIATFENQSKEFDKKLITALKIQSNLAHNASDEKKYENNSKDSNNKKEE